MPGGTSPKPYASILYSKPFPEISERLGLGSLPINYEMKELCQLCGTRIRLLEIKHALVGFTLLRCYTFILKKVTFSLCKNTELPTSLDVFLSLFLSGHVCSLHVWTKFPRNAWRSFPNVVEIPPNHIRQKKNVFFHVYDFNSGGCVVCILGCDWSKVSTNHNELVWVDDDLHVWWTSQCDRIVSRSVHVNRTYLFGQKFAPCHPIRRRNKIPG